MSPKSARPVDAVKAQPHAEGRALRHQHFATHVHQPLVQRQMLGATGNCLDPVLGQLCRRIDLADRVRLQRLRVVDDHQLDPVASANSRAI